MASRACEEGGGNGVCVHGKSQDVDNAARTSWSPGPARKMGMQSFQMLSIACSITAQAARCQAGTDGAEGSLASQMHSLLRCMTNFITAQTVQRGVWRAGCTVFSDA